MSNPYAICLDFQTSFPELLNQFLEAKEKKKKPKKNKENKVIFLLFELRIKF